MRYDHHGSPILQNSVAFPHGLDHLADQVILAEYAVHSAFIDDEVICLVLYPLHLPHIHARIVGSLAHRPIPQFLDDFLREVNAADVAHVGLSILALDFPHQMFE